jgi:hypothetical protein
MPDTGNGRRARARAGLRLALALAAPALLCASSFAAITPARPDDSRRDDENFQDFLDVPFPSEMTLEKGQSVVYQRRDVTSGRLVGVVSMSTDEMLDYYDRHLPRHGWTPRAEVAAGKTSVSTWSKGTKTLTVVAEQVTLSVGARSRVTLYIAPPHNKEDLGQRTVYQTTQREHRERYSTTPIRGGSGGGSSRGGYSEEDL